MFMALMVVMVSWVYAYPQTHSAVTINYIQLFTYQLHLNKVVLKINKQKKQKKYNGENEN